MSDCFQGPYCHFIVICYYHFYSIRILIDQCSHLALGLIPVPVGYLISYFLDQESRLLNCLY